MVLQITDLEVEVYLKSRILYIPIINNFPVLASFPSISGRIWPLRLMVLVWQVQKRGKIVDFREPQLLI
jgi:hypothetical protein